jgi:threonine aldolase
MISVPALTEAIVAGQSRLSTPPSLLCLENTHNAAGGRVMSPSHLAALAGTAHSNGLKVHLDGARIFNAAVALDKPVKDFVRHVDTTTFCLCKGLSCPLGAVVAGSTEVVARTRRWRQILGGGMRQAGVIAAAGRVALRSMISRLEQDHQNAKLLATRLRDAGLDLDPSSVDTNIVFINMPSGSVDPILMHGELLRRGVLVSPPKAGRMRLVTHRQISQADVVAVSDVIAQICEMARGHQPSSERTTVGVDVSY